MLAGIVALVRLHDGFDRDAKFSGRTKPDQVNRSESDQKADLGHDISARLAIAEAALDAEREKNQTTTALS